MKTAIAGVIAAISGGAGSVCAADAPSHVQVIELQHTREAMAQTYRKGERVPLPRVIAFDGQRRLIFGETGYHSALKKELHQSLQKDRPMAVPITLAAVLAETTDRNGAAVTVDTLPPADLYVVDYWADWCRPCHMLAHDIDDTLNHWAGLNSVWIKIESDPEKKSKG